MIPRVAASGEAIYRGRVPSEEIELRLETCWRPYHTALSTLVEQTHRQFGTALLIDAHSMPSSASGVGPRERDHRVDIVLGDNHGESCAPDLVDGAERWFADHGLKVQRNQPYAGGFTTQRYGRPGLNRHALQIEINRSLYMDEGRHQKLANAAAIQRIMTGFLEEIAARRSPCCCPGRWPPSSDHPRIVTDQAKKGRDKHGPSLGRNAQDGHTANKEATEVAFAAPQEWCTCEQNSRGKKALSFTDLGSSVFRFLCCLFATHKIHAKLVCSRCKA